jgi:hypothetical protein
MASTTPAEMTTVSSTTNKKFDLIIRAVQIVKAQQPDTGINGVTTGKFSEHTSEKVSKFEANRKILASSSKYFKKLLDKDTNFNEAGRSVIKLYDDPPNALRLWLEILHKALSDFAYNVEIKDVWDFLLVADKYGFDPTGASARAWFGKW